MGFNHSNYIVKTEFFGTNSCTLVLSACHRSIQSYFKIDLILIMLFNTVFIFYIENHESSVSLTENCLLLDKNENIVSTFSAFVVYKSVVTVVPFKRTNYV